MKVELRHSRRGGRAGQTTLGRWVALNLGSAANAMRYPFDVRQSHP